MEERVEAGLPSRSFVQSQPALSRARAKAGGAEGIRTLDLLDAIEARSQLRHGPTVGLHRCCFYSTGQQIASNDGALKR
jgi:hypothetical protein